MPARSAIKEIVAHSEELRWESEALWQEFRARCKLSLALLKHVEILEWLALHGNKSFLI